MASPCRMITKSVLSSGSLATSNEHLGLANRSCRKQQFFKHIGHKDLQKNHRQVKEQNSARRIQLSLVAPWHTHAEDCYNKYLELNSMRSINLADQTFISQNHYVKFKFGLTVTNRLHRFLCVQEHKKMIDIQVHNLRESHLSFFTVAYL